MAWHGMAWIFDVFDIEHTPYSALKQFLKHDYTLEGEVLPHSGGWADFEHFGALLPKWLSGSLWRLIFTISGPCFSNGAQDASG